MRASQLESIVLGAVSDLRQGKSVEDDRVEFKREWPGAEKARQLAAAANRTDGDELIYVIGIDDRTGAATATKRVDPATWWSQMETAFDEVAPELERHLRIAIDENETVIALSFRTDRSPYVVKVVNGGATEREVPIRSGTRTRSAHRHELLRLLYPTVQVPQLQPVDAYLSLGNPSYSGGDSDRVVHLTFRSSLFFEHVQPEPAFLPRHLSSISLIGVSGSNHSPVYYDTADDYALVGVSRRHDGLQVFGSGIANIRGQWSFDNQRRVKLGQREGWILRLVLGVAGTESRATCDLRFGRRSEELESGYGKPGTRYNWALLADEI